MSSNGNRWIQLWWLFRFLAFTLFFIAARRLFAHLLFLFQLARHFLAPLLIPLEGLPSSHGRCSFPPCQRRCRDIRGPLCRPAGATYQSRSGVAISGHAPPPSTTASCPHRS